MKTETICIKKHKKVRYGGGTYNVRYGNTSDIIKNNKMYEYYTCKTTGEYIEKYGNDLWLGYGSLNYVLVVDNDKHEYLYDIEKFNKYFMEKQDLRKLKLEKLNKVFSE